MGKRLVQLSGVLFLFVTLTFLIFYLTPGDVTQKWVGHPDFTVEMADQVKASFGLHDPWYVQYLRYLKNIATWQLGVSFSYYPRLVGDLIGENFLRTLILFVTGQMLAGLVGIQLGKRIGWRRGTWIDTLGTGLGIVGSTLFYPMVVLLSIWVFGYRLGWVPLGGLITPALWMDAPYQVTSNRIFGYLLMTGGLGLAFGLGVSQLMRTVGEGKSRLCWALTLGFSGVSLVGFGSFWLMSGYWVYALDLLYHLILPVGTLVVLSFGGMLLLMRDSMVQVLGQDYIRQARAKGLREDQIRDRHAARTALVPVVSHFSLQVGLGVAGSLVVEMLFSWPGLGMLLLKATVEQDLPLVLGTWICVGIFALGAHLVADLTLSWLDPRIRLEG